MIRSKTSIIGFFSLLILLGGCSASNNIQENQTAVPNSANATATIKNSGLAVPKFKNNLLVGYDFEQGFAVPAKIGNFFGFSFTTTKSINLAPG